MFSGKTSHLILKANELYYKNKKNIYIRYIDDTRYDNIINHDNYKINQDFFLYSV